MSSITSFKPQRVFTRSRGALSDKQKEAIVMAQGQSIILQPIKIDDFSTIFGNSAPVVLDIGFGSGEQLIHFAKLHPELNFIGVELYLKGVSQLCIKLIDEKLANVRIFYGEANALLKDIIKTKLSICRILFPDPWPKQRHNNRRLLQKDFVNLLVTKLSTYGVLHIATDCENYANHIISVLKQFDRLIEYAHHSHISERITTKFESLGFAKGHTIWERVFVLES